MHIPSINVDRSISLYIRKRQNLAIHGYIQVITCKSSYLAVEFLDTTLTESPRSNFFLQKIQNSKRHCLIDYQ